MTTGRWISRWVAVSGLLVLVACRGGEKKNLQLDASTSTTTALPAPEVAPTFTTTSLPCFLPAHAPHFEGDPRGLNRNVSGPGQCGRVLEVFLRDHPQAHIVSVIPIESPSAAVSTEAELKEEGTQELLVLHADRGRWPVASTLTVVASSCHDKEVMHGPSHCRAAVEKRYFSAPRTELVVPLTKYRKNAMSDPGTQTLLWILRKVPKAAD